MDFLFLILFVGALLWVIARTNLKQRSAKAPRVSASTGRRELRLPAHEERDLLAKRVRELTRERDQLIVDREQSLEQARQASAKADSFRDEVERLREELERRAMPSEEPAPQPSNAEPTDAPPPDAPPPEPDDAEALLPGYPDTEGPDDAPDPAEVLAGSAAEAFVRWCNRGGALVGRYFMFERHLHQQIPDALVKVVYRARTASTPSFRASAEGPEYWLLRLGTTDYLLPQPMSSDQFRELAPAFSGEAAPRHLTDVVPARVSTEGDLLVLVQPGSIR